MKAMIMAAGFGTRLRPLTYSIPKPMVPILNKPVLEHILEKLRDLGVTQVGLNLHAHPHMIKGYFKNGERWGIKINYSEEKSLLGTAGGVKNFEDFFKETFIVLSGDGVIDIDINDALKFHKRKKALVTIILKRIDNRLEYGVVLLKRNFMIKRFVEKPFWADVFSNLANTGMYILEPAVFRYIPKNKFFDFGHDLWPILIKKRKRLFGYITDGYWCDIGNLNEYKKAHRDALEKKINLIFPGEEIKKNVWVGENSYIDNSAKLNPPCIIGKNCIIEKDAVIGKFSSIGDGSVIKKGAEIKNCILWRKVVVGENVQLQNCIIGNETTVKENIYVSEGAILKIEP